MLKRSYWMAAIAASMLSAASVQATESAVKGGSTGFAINNSGRIELVSTPISYLNRSVAQGRRMVGLRIAQPVLCADFATPPAGAANPVGLVITDPNNETAAPIYGGITSYDYVTNGVVNSQFKVSAGSQLACCIMLPAANASCIQGTNGGAIIELLQDDGFEDSGVQSQPGSAKGALANIQVVVSGPSFVAPGANFNYSITVANVGGSAVSNVRLRDWFPKSTGGFTAALTSGSWSCTASAGASCGNSAGGGNINVDSISLDVSSSVVFSANRTMSAGVNNGTTFAVSAAVFTPPSANEIALGNNQSMLRATVQNSVPPTISDIANQPASGLLLEDTSTTAIGFTASDSDSVLTTANLSCSSQNTALIDNGDCQFFGNEPNFAVVITPNPNANGNGVVIVTVNDGFTQASDSFNVSVTPRNDAPGFALGANISRALGTVGIQQVNNFVSAISTGPADESGQSFFARTVTVDSGGSIFAVSGAPNINYSGSAPSESGNLAFVLNGTPGVASVRVRFQDNGGTAHGGEDAREVSFTITVTSVE